MGINSVLVDQGRTLTNSSTIKRVEGTTRVTQVAGTWFRCRLFLAGGMEMTDSGGHPRTVPAPQFLYGLRDSTGQPVNLNADQRLEIESVELGTAVWQLTEDPEPLRKKRAVLGYLGTLRRVDEHQVDLTVP